MTFFYNTGIQVYHLLVWMAHFFNPKARQWIFGRRTVWNELSDFKKTSKVIWFHCASLGEFEQGRPLIELIKSKQKSIQIVVSFFSPSGYENRKNYDLADLVIYLPTDSKKNAKRFLKILQPDAAIFVKYEFWYHYFSELNQNFIPLSIVSANFRKDQIFFKWYGKWFRKILLKANNIFVQNTSSKELLLKFNIPSDVTGDTRFDRVYETSKNIQDIPLIEAFKQNTLTVIAGSSWQPEEEMLAEFISNNKINIKLIIVPHDISTPHINQIEKLFGSSALKYSDANFGNINNSSILIIDSIGLLANMYHYGDVAIVGGGFSGSLHNILEPATFGIPILFGPKHKRFPEAQFFIDRKAAKSFDSPLDFESKLIDLCNNYEVREKMGKESKSIVQENIGASEQIIQKLF